MRYDPADVIGETIAHYTVLDRLGIGGMGEVYRARDSRLHREVALKVLPAALANDADYMARFAREAQVLASLNHPNIAAVYGLEEGQGHAALVMELVPGETLAERIGRGALPIEEAAGIALQIAQALEDAHEHGIIHRDLKPANVKITPEGRVKVLDFGLAKPVDSGALVLDGMTDARTVGPGATREGSILGTPGYMSPEQASGQRVDRRTDIWAFGVVLLEMLIGRKAFQGETAAHVLAAVLSGSPDFSRLPQRLPPRLDELLRRCLVKNHKARLQAIGDARVVLEEYVADPTAFERQAAAAALAGAPSRRASSLLPWMIAALAAALAIGVAIWAARPRPEAAHDVVRMRAEIGPPPLFRGSGSSVALSPDGRTMVLALGDADPKIYLRTMDQLEATPLQGTDGAYNPFFSPDGRWIGFVNGSHLEKVSISGGAPVVLADVNRGRGASWGDDDTIVFTENPTGGLMRIPATGGAPSALTTLDATQQEISHRWPQVLPGARAVLFTTLHNGSTGAARIEAVEVATGKRKVLVDGAGNGRYVSSGYLVFVKDGTLSAVPFDVDRLELTGTPVPVVQGVSENGGGHFDIARNGTLVYLEGAGSPQYQVVLVDRNGTQTPLTAERQTYVEPRFSPDGRRLAVEILKGAVSDSWVYDIARGTVTRLTFGEGSDSVPVWSPDGKWIVYGSDGKDHFGLYRKRSDGSGEEERLLDHVGAVPSSWSSDGRYILFNEISSKTGNDLWLLPLDGDRRPQPLIVTGSSEGEGMFSPDGRWIAYQSEETGRSEIYVRARGGDGGKWQVSTNGGAFARWQADGKRLYYRHSNQVMMVDVDGTGEAFSAGTPQRLFEGPFLEATIGGATYGNFDASPDGQRFAMLRGEGEPSAGDRLVVVLGFSEQLRQAFGKR